MGVVSSHTCTLDYTITPIIKPTKFKVDVRSLCSLIEMLISLTRTQKKHFRKSFRCAAITTQISRKYFRCAAITTQFLRVLCVFLDCPTLLGTGIPPCRRCNSVVCRDCNFLLKRVCPECQNEKGRRENFNMW